jgi:hypothetical protein
MKRLGMAGLLLCVVVFVTRVFAHPTLDFVTVFQDTDGGGLTADFSGRIITNPAATGGQTFDLPAAAAGIHFIFALSAAEYIEINPQNDDKILGLGLSTAVGDAIRSDTTVGTTVELVAIDSTNWLPIRTTGTWTDVN